MRYVNRNDVPIPSVFSNDKAINEKKAAIVHFNKLKEGVVLEKKSFAFSVYSDESIKLTLEKLFHGKCAYCESRYANIHPVDIEHWRPKSEVVIDEEKNKNTGYYWLAANWNNLLPSCIDCNRSRYQFDRLECEVILLGKGNWFPIANEADRATCENEENREKPLLINPCEENPEDYLEFHESGIIKWKFDENNKPYPKAKESIRVYGLNRSELVYDRRERILIIQQKMQIIESLASCLNDAAEESEIAILIEDLLSHELETLYSFQNPKQPFSIMAKQLIGEFINTFKVNND